MRIVGIWLAAVLVGACAWAADAPKQPKLVLAVIADQFRYDYLLRFRPEYHSGFERLLDHGAFFTNAHYLQAETVTAVGHSTYLSGATPSESGIIANEWFDRGSGKLVTSVSDPNTQLVGGPPGRRGSSPWRMLVSTVPDELKIVHPDSKVIGVSIKDRAAILPSGHMANAAYWYDNDSNHWVTSTYYRASLPEWAQQLNSEKIYRKYLGAEWKPLDSKNGKPFCTMVAGSTSVRFCGSIEATPWGNDMIEQFAERAIVGENLGGHVGTDVLTVSFSSNDYVGHAVGPDDPAVRDISIRTGLLMGKLLDFIDQRIGAGNTLVVLSADHGVAPVPEVNEARKMPGGRLSASSLRDHITQALSRRYGPGSWLMPSPTGMVYLNLKLIHGRKLDLAEVERVAADAAREEPHIARVYTAHDLETGEIQQDQIGRAFSLSFFAPRSPDLTILPEPYYLFEATGTSHGTPYRYDTHVPLLFLGPGIKPGVYRENVEMNDVAPTLAAILGLTEPSGSIGRVLSEMLP